MTYKTFYVKDAYINTTIYDDSAVTIPDPVLPKRLTILQPIFSSKGKANTIVDFASASLVKAAYGNDMDNVKKYGQGGINVLHGMSGGASAQICRLLPDNATTAALGLKLEITEADDIPVYERNPDGSIKTEIDNSSGHPVIKKVQKTTDDGHGGTIGVVTSGLKVKVIFDNKADPTSTTDKNVIVSGKTTTVPIFKLVYDGPGLCGNSMGQSLENDFERDDVVKDGRRYILTLYELDELGNAVKYGNAFYFSLNPDAVLIEGAQVYENLQYVYPDKDASGMSRAVKCRPYIMNNFDELKALIGKYCDPAVNPLDIDILNCLDKNGNPYDQFVLDEGSNPIGGDAIYYLGGGSDGDLQVGYKYQKMVNGNPEDVTVTAEMVEDTKKSLLKKFFYGQVDPALFDERMVFSDIVFDANYDFSVVKPAMLGKFRDLRPDIMVIADVGDKATNCTQAISLVKALYAMVDGSSAYTAAVLVHAGYTTDRALNLHLTGTYDYAYGMAKCYGLVGTFSVFAGYQNAKVETMEYDWLPYKDEFDTMLGPLRKLGCIFAFKIDRAGTVAYMSEDNMYTQTTSKLKSIRNGMVIGDGVRLGKSVLIKYVYDNEGSAGAIRKASAELGENIIGRYPENIEVNPNFYQSERDKLLETVTCDLEYKFPGMPKGFKLNIYARRGDA